MIRSKTIIGILDNEGGYLLDQPSGQRRGVYVVNKGVHQMDLVYDNARAGMPMGAAAVAGGIGGEKYLDQAALVAPDCELRLMGTAGDSFVAIITMSPYEKYSD